jgi:hypothetical protein
MILAVESSNSEKGYEDEPSLEFEVAGKAAFAKG